MNRILLRISSTVLAMAGLACAVACTSNSAAPGGGPGGGGGAGGTGGTCAPTAGAGGGIDPQTGCANAYILPDYDGGTCGLCDPGLATQCTNKTGCDWGASPSTECTPDGTMCTVVPATSFCPGGTGIECGWTSTPACPALGQAVAQQEAGAFPCVSESTCPPGRRCNVRVGNRMFCTGALFVYAKDYCSDAGADGGGSAAFDAGADAADAGP